MPYGDAALLLQYDESEFSAQVSHTVQTLCQSLQKDSYWLEVVAGYASVLVSFDQTRISMDTAHQALKTKLEATQSGDPGIGRLIEIPVSYGGVDGPDMETIMESSGLSEAGIISLHSAQDYLVCMMGFIPGFAFLSSAPKPLHHPRRPKPRLSVPAGSIGIAGWQTGIYGLESPGGWQIIGRTHVRMFDKDRPEPFLAKAGDRVRFVPMNRLSRD